MVAMPIQTIAKTGLEAAYAAANDGDTIKVPTGNRVFLHVKNGGGAPINVTIPAVVQKIVNAAVGEIDVPDLVTAVTNGEERLIGPFPDAYVNNLGNVTVNYSGVTSVTAAAILLPPS